MDYTFWLLWLLQQPTTFSNAEFPLFVTWKIGKDQRLRGKNHFHWTWPFVIWHLTLDIFVTWKIGKYKRLRDENSLMVVRAIYGQDLQLNCDWKVIHMHCANHGNMPKDIIGIGKKAFPDLQYLFSVAIYLCFDIHRGYVQFKRRIIHLKCQLAN